MKYRKKPVVIDAIKFTGYNSDEVLEFMGVDDALGKTTESIVINTLEGDMTAKIGDYIIKGVKGEFYPCDSEIFELTYELVQ